MSAEQLAVGHQIGVVSLIALGAAAAILCVYVRDVFAARRRRVGLSRTSIGADRAAALRMWKEEDADVNKVYLIAPSPFQRWTSHYSHPRSELQPSFHSAADEQRMRELLTPSKDWWAGHREGTALNTEDSLQKLDFGEAPRIVDDGDLAAPAEAEGLAADTERPSRVVANGRKTSSRSSRNSRASAATLTHTVTETVTKTISKALCKTLSSESASSRTSRSSRNSRASLRQQPQQQQQEEEEEEQKAQAVEPEAEPEAQEEVAEPVRPDSPEPEPPLSQEEEAALSSSDSDSDEDDRPQKGAASSAAAAASSPYDEPDRDFAAGGGVGDDSDSDVEPAAYPEGMNGGYQSSGTPPRSSSPQRAQRDSDDYSHLQSPGPADRSADGEDGDSILSPSQSRVSRGSRRSSGTPGRHRRQWTHTLLPGIIEPRIHRKGQGGSRW